MDYLALLRGINVGGKNIIKMDYLKRLFEELNFSDVKTYIQSGNILFKDFESDRIKVSEKIKKALDNQIDVMILTYSDMKKIVTEKPDKFGEENEKYRYDIMFLLEPLTAKEAVKEIKTRDGVDEIYEGNKIIYFQRLIEEITKSYISKIVGTPIYQKITIRNWNTTKKLYELMEEKKDCAPEKTTENKPVCASGLSLPNVKSNKI
jgi:uncharacterized protein (DUF1697 family)